ncbi:hypothetical protein BKA66DRAFT_437654 [Pyrenochaeta sp. MPI-SDFR-AT-0127]|nr:hypothetical protein BKA66DRAFT_437654 [Pyrenochaeta sp. MPI-SDFR-AT-0127]
MALDTKSYVSLASLMGKNRELSIFRPFNELTMLNLLRLQAELSGLEEGINSSCNSVKDFHGLRESNQVKWGYLVLLNEDLKEYHSAPLQAAEVDKLDYAPHGGLDILQIWILSGALEQPFLREEEARLWNEHWDMVKTYNYKGTVDRAPPFLSKGLHICYRLYNRHYQGNMNLQRQKCYGTETGTYMYPVDKPRLDKVGLVITASLSSALPMVAIIVL